MHGSEVTSAKQMEDLQMDTTRTRGGGRHKRQGGNQKQEVVRGRSSIKWLTPLTRTATVQTQQVREERWREKYKE